MVSNIPFPLLQSLRPIQKWLEQENVVEIFIQPQTVFIERLGISNK